MLCTGLIWLAQRPLPLALLVRWQDTLAMIDMDMAYPIQYWLHVREIISCSCGLVYPSTLYHNLILEIFRINMQSTLVYPSLVKIQDSTLSYSFLQKKCSSVTQTLGHVDFVKRSQKCHWSGNTWEGGTGIQLLMFLAMKSYLRSHSLEKPTKKIDVREKIDIVLTLDVIHVR